METAELADTDIEQPLEGTNEIFSGIDEVMASGNGDAPSKLPIEEDDETPNKEEPKKDDLPKKDDAPKDEPKKEEQGKKEEYPAEIKSTKAREHFDVVKREREEARRRADTAEAKNKDLETRLKEVESRSGVHSPEVATLEKQIADLKSKNEEQAKILSIKALETTDDFREKVTIPRDEANKEIDEVIEAYGLSGAAVDAALAEPNKFKRVEALEKIFGANEDRPVPQTIRNEFHSAVLKLLGTSVREKEIRENAKGNQEFAETKAREEQAKKDIQRKREWETSTKEVEDIIKAKLPELVENEDEWKKIMGGHTAVKDFDKLPAKAKAFASVASNAVMPLMRMLRNTREELKAAQKALEGKVKATPGAGGGRGSSSVTAEEEDENPNSMMDAIDGVLAGQVAR